MLSLPAGLVREKLTVLLDGRQVGSVAFEPVFDAMRGAGATIRRLLGFLFADLAHPDSLLNNAVVTRSLEENLVLSLLLGLLHNYTGQLLAQNTAAAPGNVRRAEDFMRAHADAPLTIAEIAAAAECSVRALQLAFRRFRETTPMAALRRIRLSEAREQMLRAGRSKPLARIAATYGFSNPSRFAQLFRRTYGAYPSQVLGTRHDVRGGHQNPEATAPVGD